jgi:hypothetical protein
VGGKMKAKLINTIAYKSQVNSKNEKIKAFVWGQDRYMNECLNCSEEKCQLERRSKCTVIENKKKERLAKKNERVKA